MSVEERELWACGQHLLAAKGEDAEAFVAERMRELAAKGDEDGVRTWRAIADRIGRLRCMTPSSATTH